MKLIFTVVVVDDAVVTAAVEEDIVVDGTVELPSFKITCKSKHITLRHTLMKKEKENASYQFWRRFRFTKERLGHTTLHSSFAETFNIEDSFAIIRDTSSNANARTDFQCSKC